MEKKHKSLVLLATVYSLGFIPTSFADMRMSSSCSALVEMTRNINKTPKETRPNHKLTGCFAGEVMVDTLKGKIPISEIKVGDEVFSWDHIRNEVVTKRVTKVFIHEEFDVCDLSGKGFFIKGVTTYHRFYIKSINKYLRLADILSSQVSETPLSLSPDLEILVENEIRSFGNRRTTTVYNLDVEHTHNYFVEGVLVHNGKRE